MDIYDLEYYNDLEDDELSIEEAGFMQGYLGAWFFSFSCLLYFYFLIFYFYCISY